MALLLGGTQVNGNIIINTQAFVNGTTAATTTSTGALIVAGGAGVAGNIYSGGILSVSGNANVGNLGTTRVLATGNISGTQLISNIATGTAPFIVTSTTQVANLSVATAGTAGSATTAGTVTTNAQPNITSVGTLSSVAVTANANVGNLNSTGRVIATDNMIVTSTGSEGGQLVLAYAGVNGITGQANSTWNVDVDGSNNFRLFNQNATGTVSAISMTAYSANTNVAFAGNVSAPFFIGNGSQLTGIVASAGSSIVNGTSNVVVDASGNVRTSVAGTANVMVVSSTTVTAPSFAATNNGSAQNFKVGDDAWLGDINTADTVGLIGQQNAANGYIVFGNNDTTSKLGRAGSGPLTYTGAMSLTSNVTATQFISNLSTGTAPLVVTSTTRVSNLNVATAGTADSATTAGTVTTAAQPNITSVGTLLGVTSNAANAFVATGNAFNNVALSMLSANASNGANMAIRDFSSVTSTMYFDVGTGGTANGSFQFRTTSGFSSLATISNTGLTLSTGVFNGNGNSLSSLQGANVTGQVGNALVAGTVYTNAQPNITSVGTLTGLTVGNATANTIFGNGTITATGNANVNRLLVGSGTVGAPGITFSADIAQDTGFYWVSDGNIGFATNGTLRASIADTGFNSVVNVTAPQLISNIATGTAPFVVTSTTQVANLSVATAGSATTAGTVTTNAQPNITSVGTLTSVAITGNATAGNVYANAGTIGASLLTGTLTTAAQPNITSVGTLTSLSVTGNIAAGNLTTAGVLSVTGTGVSSIAGNLDMTSNTIINLASPTNANDAATKQYVDDVAQGLHTHDTCNAATNTTLATISGGTVTYNNGTSGVGATLTTTGTYTTIDGVTLSNGMRILVKNEANAAHNGIYDRTSTTVLTRSTDFDTPAEMAGGDFTFVTAGTLYDNTGWVMVDVVTTVGTTAVNWVQFSGAGTYTAGTGLTLSGSQFSITNTAVSAGTYGNSDAVATFTVNGQGQLTAASNTVIQANAANLSGTTLKSTVVNSSLTSVGTLTSLGVTGTTTSGNFATAGNITASFLVSNVATGTAPLTVTSTTKVANLNVEQVDGYHADITATVSNIAVRDANANLYANNYIGTTYTSNVATGTAPIAVSSTTRVANLNVAYANVADNINVVAGTGNNFLIFANAATGNVAELTSTGLTANLSNNSITATTFVGALSGAATSATTAGTVTTAAQPNITSVGTLTGLTVGNATANAVFGNGTITLNSGLITGNGNGLSSLQAANITGTLPTSVTNAISNVGTITVGTWNSTFTAGLNANTLANIQGGNVSGAVASATAATNASALLQNTSTATSVFPTFTTSSANGNSSAVINTGISANLGNASITATTFVGALSGTATSATTAGTVTTNAQPNITSVGTLTSLGVSGTVTASTLTSNVATGTAPLTVTSTTRVANLNVAQANVSDFISVAAGTGNNFIVFANAATGNIAELTSTGLTANLSNNSITATTFVGALSGAATSATTAGTVTTNAQPNITSVGTLTSLAVSGTSNLNAVGNVTITGGSTGQVLTTDGSGGLSWTTVSGGGGASISNGTSNVNIATSGGNITMGVGGTANVVTVTSSNVQLGTGIGGNISGANVITANTFVGALTGAATTVSSAAQSNITSVGTLTSLAVSGTSGLTSTDSSAAASVNKIIRAVNGTQEIAFIPRASVGAFNSLTVANDSLLTFANSAAQGNANLTIAPWATGTSGIRIQSVSNVATIFLNAANTNVAGTTLLATSSGNVGIGTSTPSEKLHVVQQGASVFSRLQANTGFAAQYSTTRGTVSTFSGFDTAGDIAVLTTDAVAPLLFSNNGFTERMRITSDGNVGIGTSAPATMLDVSGAATVDQNFFARTGGVWFNAANTFTRGIAQDGLNVVLYTQNSERMRITSDGNIGIGVSTVSAGRVQINGQTSDTDGTTLDQGQLYITDSDNSTTSGLMIGYRFQSGVAEYARLQGRNAVGPTAILLQPGGGNVLIGSGSPSYQLQLTSDSAAKPSTNTWTIASDQRIKTVTGEYTKGLDAVCGLRPVKYKYNGTGGFVVDDKENISIIAQEAMEYFPECVGTFEAELNEGDETKTELYNWNGHALTFALVNAVKELKAMNEALAARITQLEGK